MSSRAFFLGAVLCVLGLSCKGPEGPAGLPGEGIESLTDPAIMPNVLTTYPLSGSTGPYTDFNNRITLRFNKIMDRTSIKRAVHLSSPLGDVELDTTSISAQNTDVFTLAPLDSRGSSFHFYWKIGNHYTVVVDTSAFDVNGNHLRLPFAMTFLPEPWFRVTNVSPANGATEVALGSNITIAFNSQVDSSIFRHVAISPALTGNWGYIAAFPAPDSTQIRFFSQGALFDTLYTIQVDTMAVDKNGDHLGIPFRSTFTTLTFRIASTSPVNGSVQVGVLNTPQFNFTAPIDTGSVYRAWSISPPVTGKFSWRSSYLAFSFVPDQRLLANTTYTITLSDSLMSRAGTHLAQPFSMSFTTAPFRVSSTSPSDGLTDVSLAASISVVLTDYYDTSTVRSSVMISPSVPLLYSLKDNSTSFTLRPLNGFQSNTSYIVMLTTGLHSKRGDSLAIGASFSFTTTSFAVSFTNPQDGQMNVNLSTTPTVYFNEAIDTGSVRSAFSISPQVGGDLLLSPGSSFSFRPFNLLDPNTIYTVTIGNSLASANGSRLAQSYSFSFSTGNFSVVPTSPSTTGAVDFPLSSPITFSSNAYLDTASIRSALSISPATAGSLLFTFTGSACTGFGFRPVAWASNTQYSATVSTALRTTSGVQAAAPVSVTFTTTQFRLVYTSPLNGSINVGLNPNIYLQFNGPIDTTGVDTVLTFSPPIHGLISAAQGANYLSYSQYQSLRTNTRYSMMIASSLRTVGGGTLAAPDTIVFSTAPFEVITTTPQDGSVGISKSGTISLGFNTTIDTGSVRGAFSISPPVEGNFYLYSPSYGFSFTPAVALSAQTKYTIQLSTAMRTQLGDTLLAPYTMSFTTGN